MNKAEQKAKLLTLTAIEEMHSKLTELDEGTAVLFEFDNFGVYKDVDSGVITLYLLDDKAADAKFVTTRAVAEFIVMNKEFFK